MDVIGAIDQGTQSTRFYLFNTSAEPLVSHQVDLRQIYPAPGWCEHDPLEIWESVQLCINEALKVAEKKLGALNVRALGITNQRETLVAWSRSTGKPLYNAIVWLDTRTRDICKKFEKELGDRDFFRPVTGLPISTYFSAFKLKWMLENVEPVRAAAVSGDCQVGTVDSWLLYNLTGGPQGGVHVTDVTNASRTMLMDLSTLTWHPPFLELFGVAPAMLPRVVSNAELYGTVSSGPLEGTPIAGCLGDQMAAMLGQRCVRGEAKNTYGTGCFMLLHTGAAPVSSSHGLLTTLAYKLGPDAPPQYALEGSVAVAGFGVSWLRDGLGLISSAAESESLAREVPDTGGVYFVPAFSGLLAPHWDSTARGVIVGLTGASTRGHVCRAMLEAICFQTREVLDAMRADAELDLRVLRVDGGAAQNDLLMQLQADLLQVPVLRPHFQESTSLGAALAAGLAVGVWRPEQVFEHDDSRGVTFNPAVGEEDTQARHARWKKAVSRSRDLADLAD